jgi:outer membrane biosynthesis protein TonB
LKILHNLLQEFKAFAITADPKYAHITEDDRSKVLNKCAEIESWLIDAEMHQNKLAPHMTPSLLCETISEKSQQLTNACNLVRNKPKPEEKKEEPKKEEAKKEEPKKTEDATMSDEKKVDDKKVDNKKVDDKKVDAKEVKEEKKKRRKKSY